MLIGMPVHDWWLCGVVCGQLNLGDDSAKGLHSYTTGNNRELFWMGYSVAQDHSLHSVAGELAELYKKNTRFMDIVTRKTNEVFAQQVEHEALTYKPRREKVMSSEEIDRMILREREIKEEE